MICKKSTVYLLLEAIRMVILKQVALDSHGRNFKCKIEFMPEEQLGRKSLTAT